MKLLIAGLVLSLTLGCRASDAMAATLIAPESIDPPTNLEQIVHLYQQQSGVTLTYDDTTAQCLQSISVAPVGPDGDLLLIDSGAAATNLFEVLPLRYANAAVTANILLRLVHAAGASPAGPDIRITADERTNSVVVRADPEHLAHLKSLIARLDTEQSTGG